MAAQPNGTRDRFIKLREVKAYSGLSTSEIYRRMDAGTFPAQVRLGAKAVAWLESEVQGWIAQTVQAGREGLAHGH